MEQESCPCRVEFAQEGPTLEEGLREILARRREGALGWTDPR